MLRYVTGVTFLFVYFCTWNQTAELTMASRAARFSAR